ncbi:hypothetical protein ACFVI1_25575, partial [Streptomyces pratensis]
AASAKTARDAANSADIAASDAASSAADATLSSELAQVHASNAAYSADQARLSELAAGKDAAAAFKAATEAFSIAVTKQRQEEEARRKAAVAEKEKNEAGQRATARYRCGQAIIPCEGQEFVRWCQHDEIYCSIVAKGDEFGAAMDQLWNGAKALAGLSELEACMKNKDLESCWALAAGVLVGAKLKALDKAVDALKLLKRGCKIASKTAGVSRAVQTSSADVPCFSHDVPGLPRDKSMITKGPGDCKACAERIRDSLGGGEIVRFGPPGKYFGNYRGQDTSGWSHHYVVVLNDRVYDAFAPKGGESIAQYKAEWFHHEFINFGF